MQRWVMAGSIHCLLLAGCAHTPKPLIGCDLPRTLLTVSPDSLASTADARAAVLKSPPNDFERKLIESVEAKPPPLAGDAYDPARLLFISGGSERGAYGAGLLDQWRIRAGSLPSFQTVTGVSTGALIGVTAFLGHTKRTVASYTIHSEADILDVKARSPLGIARKGAAATFAPLRRGIGKKIDDKPGDGWLIGEMAAAADKKRRFLIGVTELREGAAYAIDMTELAQRWRTAALAEAAATAATAATAPAARAAAARAQRLVRQCFIEALVASASVPGAVPPVYIDKAMYVDGGVMFGVFRANEDSAMARIAAYSSARAFRIVNNPWNADVQCPAATGPKIETQATPCAAGPPHSWSIDDIGLRSIDLLTHSVYRFSTVRAGRSGDPPPAVIDGVDNHAFTFADSPAAPPERLTCAQWRKRDNEDRPAPIEFHRRAMLCMIDFGRSEMDLLQWWRR